MFDPMNDPLNILYIEDKLADFKLVERHLVKHGPAMVCTRVSNHGELLAALASQSWDLVLSDYNLPLLPFDETLRLLRPALENLPVILLSGSLGEERAVELLKQGVWDFVLKDNLTRLVPSIQRNLRDAADRGARQRAEAALRESEKKHRRLFESSRDAILTIDPASGKFTTGNPAALKMFGVASEAELTARRPVDVSAERQPDGRLSAERLPEIHATVLREGSMMYEWKHRRLDGWEFFADVLLTRMERDGRVEIMSTVRDISERKQAAAALRESEEQFRAMFETASIGMAQANPRDGQLQRVNRKLCEITGYTAEELLQLKAREITHPSDRDRDWEMFQRVVRGELPSYQLEKRYVRKDGKIIWVNLNMTVVRNPSGQAIRTVAMIEDITARRAAEEERLRLSTALEQTAESIVITDLEGMILYVNPAFEKVSGYSRREVIGQNPRVLNSHQQPPAFFKGLWATLKRGEVWHGSFVNRRKDGTLYQEEASISPVRDVSGEIVNYMAIKLDVSREVELEKQFRQSQKMEAIGQLAGGVAHDFNNILTSIQMQIELANMENDLSPELREGLDQIRSDADRAASLTRQLLLFSRRQVMQSQDLDLNEIVTHLAKMLQRIIGEDVRLQLNLHPAPLMTHADPGMLDQVAMNLAVNARDAMPEGGRLLIETSEKSVDAALARQYPDAVPGLYVCLSVTDTGRGIPPEVLPRIFEPFFTTKEAGKGTGLGLATVFGIVNQHHGWLAVESEPGHGTTFKVYLPAAMDAAATAMVKSRSTPRGGTETLLLVEDDPSVRKATVTLLRFHGYQVLEAASGPEAVALWHENREAIALLFTDLVMPGGMSGQQLAQKLQSERTRLKVIFSSGYSADIAGRELHLQAGENFLQKPFPPEKLLKTIRDCLDG